MMASIRDIIILIYLYAVKISKYILPRALAGFVGFLVFSSNVDLFARFLINGFYPIIGENYNFAYAISVMTLYSVGWVSYGFVLNASEALGFRNRKEISSYNRSNISIYNEIIQDERTSNESNSSNSLRKLSMQNFYRRGDPLGAFHNGRNRIQEHVFRLQNNSIINLFTAMTIAIVGILVLGSAFFEIENYHDTDRSGFKIYDFLIIAVLPRISISVFLQVFSYFFLIMYRSNLNDVRYFQNEMTNIDYHAAAISMAMRNDVSTPQKSAIIKLLSMERNRLMKKNQRVISANDDEKIIEKIVEIEKNVKALGRNNLRNNE